MANQCEQLARLLRAEGMWVDLVQTNKPYRPSWVRHLPLVRAAFRLIPYLLAAWRAVGQAQVIHVLANSGWAWYLFSAPVLTLAKWRGKPVIVNYRGGLAQEFLAAAPRFVHRSLQGAALRVTPSGFLGRVFAGFGLSSEVIPNIVDLARFQAQERPAPGPAPRLLVARNLEPIYGVDVAIRALALVRKSFPAATLTVAGSGPELLSLQSLCKELGLDDAVVFSGRVDNVDMPGLYGQADLAVNASSVDNMPNALLEAFASGVPVVSTRAGGIPDMLEHEVHGLLVPVGDPAALADAAIRLLSDPELAARLCAAASKEAQRYAWPSVKSAWLDAYHRVSAGKVAR
jgi:glycosyltransferase involved in cell wall biosynthesis